MTGEFHVKRGDGRKVIISAMLPDFEFVSAAISYEDAKDLVDIIPLVMGHGSAMTVTDVDFEYKGPRPALPKKPEKKAPVCNGRPIYRVKMGRAVIGDVWTPEMQEAEIRREYGY